MLAMLVVMSLALPVTTKASAQTAVHAAKRSVALVVGAGDYRQVDQLVNPASDARALATATRELGFETFLALDPAQQEFMAALDRFYAAIRDADVVLFYFAGHGVQVNGRNYLVPVDIDPRYQGAILESLISLNDLLSHVERVSPPSAAKIFILDSCRNNPFAARVPRPGERIDAGFQRISLDAPVHETQGEGYFRILAYATAASALAEDGSGAHSPYTGSLIKHIRQAGLEVGEMFRRVASDVVKQTGGAQRPEYLVQTSRPLYFRIPYVTECDRLAVDAQNFVGISGRPFDDIDPLRAIPACEKAIRERPDSARLRHNLARAYEKAERLRDAFEHYKSAADAGYPPAINALGIMYLAGCGLPKPEPFLGIPLIARASELGNLSAAATLSSFDLLPHLAEDSVVRLKLALASRGDFSEEINGRVTAALRKAVAAAAATSSVKGGGLTLGLIHELGLYDITPPGFRCH